MKRSTRYVLAAAMAVVFVTNAIVLVGAWYNRSGEPDATVTMTERELSLPPQYGMFKEDSGLSLQVEWRVLEADETFSPYQNYYGRSPGGVNQEKLAELGFDVKEDPDSPDAFRHYNKILPKDVFLVLEYDGAAYRKLLDLSGKHLRDEEALAAANSGKKEFVTRAADARKNLEAEQHRRSRLFVIDAGTDPDSLRGRYPDRTRYFIAHGVVRLYLIKVSPSKTSTQNGDKSHLEGIITDIHMTDIHVPLALRGPLDALISIGTRYTGYGGPPRYSVTMKVGRRLEPWITDVTALAKE